MKRLTFSVLIVLASVGLGQAQEAKFSRTLDPDEYAAAGLNLLSPEQRSRLDALIAAHLSRSRPAVRKPDAPAPTASAAPTVSTTPVASPATKVVVTPDAATAAKPAMSDVAAQPNLIPAPKKREAKSSNLVIESTIPGKFRGWEGRTIFVLANGQRLQVANNESYFTPAVESPRVQVLRASLAGYWLRFPDLDVQVRVNLVGE